MEVAGVQQEPANSEGSGAIGGEKVVSGHCVASSSRPGGISSVDTLPPAIILVVPGMDLPPSPSSASSCTSTLTRPESRLEEPPPPPPPHASPSSILDDETVASSTPAGDASGGDGEAKEEGAPCGVDITLKKEPEALRESGEGTLASSVAQTVVDTNHVAGTKSAAQTVVYTDPVGAETVGNGIEGHCVSSSSAEVVVDTKSSECPTDGGDSEIVQAGDNIAVQAAEGTVARSAAESMLAESTADETVDDEADAKEPTVEQGTECRGSSEQREEASLAVHDESSSFIPKAEGGSPVDRKEEEEKGGNGQCDVAPESETASRTGREANVEQIGAAMVKSGGETEGGKEASETKRGGVSGQEEKQTTKREEKDEAGNATGEDKGTAKVGGSGGRASSASGEGDETDVLYPMMVTGPSGEKVELMVLPTDTVMDIRQFLADAPETCFYTCYDLILTLPTGIRYQLMDYLELLEVCDVAAGGCKLEMVDAFYDDRMVRNHVRRTRDLISTSSIHMSLSTKLAMEFEKSLTSGKDKFGPERLSSKTQGGATKSDVEKADGVLGGVDGLGFMEDSAGHLLNLLVAPQACHPEGSSCLEKLAFSSLNPVPGYRRLQGDILYLDVVTLEGKKLCITAHQKGYFVNKTTTNVLNPEPASPSVESTTLVGLLRKASDKFATGFSEVWENKGAGHQFENMQLALPPNPWLGAHPPAAHVRDVARAEEALLTPYGTDVMGIQRDWNEELQSCRELPRESLQDRIIRDRALYKVSSDFVESAIKGAKAVIGHSITPINPTDPERFHMYVHNGIFFSFAVDGDFVMIQQLREEELKQKQQVEPSVDSTEVTGDQEKLDAVSTGVQAVEGETPSGGSTADAFLPGAKQPGSNPLVLEGEQATYASANNDLRGTRAFNTADVPGLYTLAMAIVDYRGYRVVAQSIIPGILYGDKSASLLYGSVDGGKRIAWNEKFHAKMCEVGKVLHIAEHSVEDGSAKSVMLCGPVECKGIVGSDDRHYILDLMRTTPRDIHYSGSNSRLCVLRPELVASFCQSEALEKVKDAGDAKKEADALASISLNPNVFTDFKVTGDLEEVKKDEELVKKAAEFLVETVIPKLIQDFNVLEVSPMDGQTLTEALHAHGVNIRYLGKIASLSESLIHIKDLCISEMIVRSAKHVLKAVLRETMDQDVGGAIAHFLNCFLGTSVGSSPPITPASLADAPADPSAAASGGSANVEDKDKSSTVSQDAVSQKSKTSRKKKKGGKGGSGSSPPKPSSGVTLERSKGSAIKEDVKPGYTRITSELVWGDIQEGVKFKYQFELPDDARSSMRKLSVLRSFCQKMGITIAAREYNFESEAVFAISDILDLHPVVKHCASNCADARDLMDGGKIRLSQGKIDEALELFSEAVAILQQVCGPLHREVANCCRYLAMAHYHKQDLQNAVVQQHKELIINERVLGVDHPDTAHSYGNMALFYHGLGHTELALKHMQRTLHLLNVACGPDHPDVAATFINVAMMYQDIQKMHVALRYLQEALMQNEKLLGPEHLQTAVCFHALAIAFNCMGAYKLSLQHERSTYNILLKQLGEEDPRTKDSAHWVRTFQIRELQAQKQRGQAAQLAAAQKAAQAIQARADLVSALAAASRSGGRGIGKGIRGDPAALAVSMASQGSGIRHGMDERAQKAAAEVRRRAAARSVAASRLHASGGHAGGTVPLDELLSFINGAHGAIKVSSSSGVGVSKGGGTRGGSVVKGDIGLGAGLVSAVGLGSGGPGESSTQGERKAGRGLGIPSPSSPALPSNSKMAIPLGNRNAVKEDSAALDQGAKVPEGLGMGLGALDADSKKKKGKVKKPKQQQ